MNIEFKISIADFDADAWKRLGDARKEVASIEAEIIKSYKDSLRYKAALDLAGISDYSGKYTPITRIETSRIVTSVNVDTIDDREKPSGPTLFLGEKTINALLSGKLLTDDQKKALLLQIGVDVEGLSEKAGA